MNADGLIWSIVTIGGPIILAAVLLWALLHNRSSAREKAATDRATRRVREEENDTLDAADDRAP